MESKYEYKDSIENMSNEEVSAQQEKVMNMDLPGIRILDFKGDRSSTVRYEYDELTALCPMTGLPDCYNLNLAFTPEQSVPELKSLKMYLMEFRNIPILHEHLACRIYRDFKDAVSPDSVELELTAAIRGGIRTTVSIND